MSLLALNEETFDTVSAVSPEDYRQGMASLAAAVNVVTTQSEDGKAGFTATAVCSVSDNPATLLVCLNRGASVHKAFAKSISIAINTLTSSQQLISNLFGGKAPMNERFESGEWETLVTGAPVLVDAAVCFDCIITEVKSVATHDVIFCQVVGIKQDEHADALLYYQRGYRDLACSK